MATEFAVSLLFKSQGGRQIQDLANRLQGVESSSKGAQRSLESVSSSLRQQNSTSAQLASQLRRLKGDYDQLTASAKASAREGGEGFNKDVVNRLRGLSTEIGRTRNAFRESKAAAASYKAELDRTAAASQQAGGKLRGLTVTLGGLVKGYAALQAFRFVLDSTRTIERTTKQLETLTGSANNARVVLEQLQEINKKSPFELGDLADTAAKLTAFGISLDKVVSTTEQLGKLSAATGQDINGIALAYGQVAAKGRLQTEELLQFQERGIPLQKELAKQLKVTEGQLADMITKGKVGFPEVEKAIRNMTTANGKFAKAFENTADTVDAKLSNMKDAWVQAAAAIGTAFAPLFKWMIDQITAIGNAITAAFARFADLRAGGARAQAEFQAEAKAQKATRDRYGALGMLTPQARQFREAYKKNELFNYDAKTKQGLQVPKGSAPPPPASTSAPSGGSSGGGSGAGKKDNSAAELAALQQSVTLKERLFQLDKQIQAAELAKNEDLKFSLEFEKQMEETAGRIAEIKASDVSAAMQAQQIREAEIEGMSRLSDLTAQRQQREAERQKSLADITTGMEQQMQLLGITNEAERKRMEFEYRILELKEAGTIKTEEEAQALRGVNDQLIQQEELRKRINFQQEQINGLVNGLGQQFSSLFDTLLQGTNDWKQALTGALRQMSSLLLNAGFKMLGNDGPGPQRGLFSILSGNFGGARAAGGPVSSGKSYLVGEDGPEMFTPGRSGMITPNGAGGGVNSVVNITITDSGTKVDSTQASHLGRLVETTVVGVLQRERRPGGMLSR